MSRTLNDLISETRSVLDEDNEANLDDTKDIIPAINRGYDFALATLARHYVSPILASVEVSLTSGTQEYDIPKDALEERILKVEVFNNSSYQEVLRVDYSQVTPHDTTTRTNFPYYYTVIGNRYRLMPPPTATYPLRVWYAKHPGHLVRELGRVEVIGSNYVVVDEADEDLSTTGLAAYVNLVDGQTGTIKATMQVQSIASNKLTFRSSPDRSVVFGRDTTGTLPSDLAVDDYVCSAEGSAIPILRSTIGTYLVQYAVAEITRKLGGEPTIEEKVKQDLEVLITKMPHARETYTRVKKRSREWGHSSRRLLPSNGS